MNIISTVSAVLAGPKRHGVAYTFVSDYGAMVRLDEIAKFTRNAITAVSVDMEGNLLPVKKG